MATTATTTTTLTNFTVTSGSNTMVTCVISSDSNGENIITVTTVPVAASSPIDPSSPPSHTRREEVRVQEVVNVNDEEDEWEDSSSEDWETEEEESVVSEDDRDPILFRLKKRRLAAIEKAEKEVVAREALDLSSAECLICLTNPRTVAVVPCGHIISCDPCSKKLSEMIKHSDGFKTVDGTTCPTCRGEVKHLLRLYA